MSRFRANSLINLVFNYSNVAFNLITGIFLVPLYLRKIPLEVYGSFVALTSIAGLIGLLEFGLSMVLTQRLSKSFALSDWQQFRKSLYSGIVAATILFILSCLTTLSVATFVEKLTNISTLYQKDLRTAFILLGVASAVSIYLNLFGSIFQALLKAGTLGSINILSAAVGISTVLLAFYWHSGLAAIAAGTLARVLCANTLLLLHAWRALSKLALLPQSEPFSEVIVLLRTCIPIFLGSVSKSLAENAQNLLLANLVSPAAVAIFSLTQKVMQVCIMVLAPIGSSIYSVLTQIKEKSRNVYFSSLLGISIRFHFMLSVVLVGTAIVFNEPFVTLWVGVEKFGGNVLTLLIGVSTLLFVRFSFFSFLIYSVGDFNKPLILEISYSLTKIFLLFFLVPHLGILAIPIADIAAGFIFLYFLSTRLMILKIGDSPFRSGIYFNGWIELVIIVGIGNLFINQIVSHASWLILGINSTIFCVVAALFTLALNSSFIRNAKEFQRQKFRVKS